MRKIKIYRFKISSPIKNKIQQPEEWFGYLLNEDEEDRRKELLTVNIFYINNDFIMVYSENELMIEDIVKYHIKLNAHAYFDRIEFGWLNEDFVNLKYSARIWFKFLPI